MKPLSKWSFADIIEFAKHVDKKTWMTVASAAIGSLLVLIFLVIPAWVERPWLRRDIQSMESQIRQVNALSQKRPVWEENQEVFGALIEKAKSGVFTAENLGSLLGQVSKMANESRVEVLTSKPLAEKTVFVAPYNTKYQPSGYEFTLQGGYHDLGKLVSRIETYEKLLRIRSIQILPSKQTDRHVAELKLWAITTASPGAAPGVGDNRAKK